MNMEMLKKAGKRLGWLLLAMVVVWVILDIIAWQTGVGTFSQWVVATAEKHYWFAWLTTGIIILLPTWLFFHFELPRILFGRFKKKPKAKTKTKRKRKKK